ncbi:hypothetical protein PAXRUDRAFT_835054 [Paxillus rubicundulus Ve08.2h10]|uniref:Unplaced genomic scaffold scaffold_2255, whole genome shotgun sequence n=1 Tax=Paxillus rubicundulus Ve08.2h10 TaxID=930991 RepID=A0A0D0C213_9AGAM|nr:hypothetical protein PAXRUDRAFT_835054 [Paxillus rubicundulus Ve08.2h10]
MFNTDSKTDTDKDQNQTPPCPIQLRNTRQLRGMLTGNIAEKVLGVLSSMESIGLNLSLTTGHLGMLEKPSMGSWQYKCTG